MKLKSLLSLTGLFTKDREKTNNRPQNPNLTRATNEANKARGRRGKQIHTFGGCNGSNSQAFFQPKRTKFKGWMRNKKAS
jgi:hypothetical protein